MPFQTPINLNNKKDILTHDGVFDSFDDTTLTNAQFTNNSNNVGSSFTQANSLLTVLGHTTLQTKAVKYQNVNGFVPSKVLPWTTYLDTNIEMRLKIINSVNCAGFAISHADMDFDVTDEKLWVGIYRDTVAGLGVDSGIVIIDPTNGTTKHFQFNVQEDTWYYLTVRMYYNFWESYAFKIDVWLDNNKVVEGHEVNRGDIQGLRLDGKYGIALDMPILRSYSLGSKKDEHALSNGDGTKAFTTNDILMGQTFTATDTYYLKRAVVDIIKVNSIGGSAGIKARLYATSGGVPTGSPLAESDDTDVWGMSDSVKLTINLDFPKTSTYQIQNGVTYWIGIYYDGGLGLFAELSSLAMYGDVSSPAHAGACYYGTVSPPTSTDGAIDIVFELYAGTPDAGGDRVDFDYWCGNRLDYIVSGSYRNTYLGEIGQLEVTVLNNQAEGQMKVGKESNIFVYRRHSVSGSWYRRFFGIVDSVEPHEKFPNSQSIIKASSRDRRLDGRTIVKSYTTQTTHYMIKDATNGFIPLRASDLVTTNNVTNGIITLDKNFYDHTIREAIMELTAEEDYFAFIDDDNDLHFTPVTLLPHTGKHLVYGDGKLVNYKFSELGADRYSQVEVKGTKIHVILKNPFKQQNEGGEQTKVIIEPKDKTEEEALRRAMAFFSKNVSFMLGEMVTLADYELKVGHIVNVTALKSKLPVVNKPFVILEIDEDLIFRTQKIAVAEQTNLIADMLYEQFAKTRQQDQKRIDTSVTTPKVFYNLVFILGWKMEYLVEISTDGSTWETWDSGKCVITNRGMAIATAMVGNLLNAATGVYDGVFANITMRVGDGTADPKTTNTALNNQVGTKTVDNHSIVPEVYGPSGQYRNKATATWSNSELNGYTLCELGYNVNRADVYQGYAGPDDTQHKYATTSKWAPYNVYTQIHCHAKFKPFAKTSSHHFRFTIYVYAEELTEMERRAA